MSRVRDDDCVHQARTRYAAATGATEPAKVEPAKTESAKPEETEKAKIERERAEAEARARSAAEWLNSLRGNCPRNAHCCIKPAE